MSGVDSRCGERGIFSHQRVLGCYICPIRDIFSMYKLSFFEFFVSLCPECTNPLLSTEKCLVTLRGSSRNATFVAECGTPKTGSKFR